MKIIDAHHHLWNRDLLHYPWLEDRDAEAIFGNYDALRRNYLIEDYFTDFAGRDVVKSIHIQAEHDHNQTLLETRWLQGIADSSESRGFPHGIVAFADLSADNVEETIEAHCNFLNVKGIRQILNYHADKRLTYTPHNLLENNRWRKNFRLLEKYNLSFDLQLYPGQMTLAAELARQNDTTPFALNHTGMPVERNDAGLEAWREGMALLAVCDNVCVKISGLGMCDPGWTTASIRPFVLNTIELFGVNRCMFASNFPVDSLFSDFNSVFTAFELITSDFSDDERRALFRDNAERFYRL